MDQFQKNRRKMFGNVLGWFDHAGEPLLGIKKINEVVTRTTAGVAALDTEAARQATNTTGLTHTRQQMKAEAADKAEALRGLVVVLTDDAVLRTALAKPVSKYRNGADAGFLAYATQVADAVGTLNKQDLTDAGYDAQVLATLRADLAALTASAGEARLLLVAGAAVTDGLPALFGAVDEALANLDKFVGFQGLAQPGLVQQYEALRTLPKTPRHQQFRASGSTPYDEPQVVFNLLEQEVPAPTLHNTGGKGHEVVFYLGATAGSRPRAGQGVAVKNGKKLAVADYATLGDPATEPFVLVLQTSQLPPGGWRVRG